MFGNYAKVYNMNNNLILNLPSQIKKTNYNKKQTTKTTYCNPSLSKTGRRRLLGETRRIRRTDWGRTGGKRDSTLRDGTSFAIR